MPPEGHTYADVLSVAHPLRVEKGDYATSDIHLADALAELTEKKIKITA
jgi:glyoxalase family protein